MLLDLGRLRGEERLSRRYAPEAFGAPDESFRLAAPVGLEAVVRKDGHNVRLAGLATAELECACSRCLEPFTVAVDARFDLLFLPASENTGEGEREVDAGDLDVGYYRDETIDLGEVLREQFYLALPMKPLCRDDCRGLCPVCGANWNRETCECRPAWQDPRLAALKDLKNR